MCEEACPVDAIELTSLADLTGLSREEMMFDKEKLLSVFDQTVPAGTDPVRTKRGRLSVASEPLTTGQGVDGSSADAQRSDGLHCGTQPGPDSVPPRRARHARHH